MGRTEKLFVVAASAAAAAAAARSFDVLLWEPRPGPTQKKRNRKKPRIEKGSSRPTHRKARDVVKDVGEKKEIEIERERERKDDADLSPSATRSSTCFSGEIH